MTFVSIYFFIFILVLAILYFCIPKNWRWIVLLLGSAVFYALGGMEILAMVLVTTLIAYIAGILIERTEVADRKKRRLFLSIAIVIIAGFLVFTKCYSLAGWNISYFVIPVGISYYTFSIISYLADIYWKRDQAEKNYFKLALFVLYFPKVLQGPISRHKQLGPQLTEGHSFDYTNMCYGVQLMLWGYFKKMVIADRVAIVTGTILGDYTSYGGAVLLTGVVLASVQLYCDFSGYMDIARGVSQIFGINLDENFNHPFFSKSAAEFWRRWHITLGTWFKDYIYMPLVISPCMIKASAWFKKRCGKGSYGSCSIIGGMDSDRIMAWYGNTVSGMGDLLGTVDYYLYSICAGNKETESIFTYQHKINILGKISDGSHLFIVLFWKASDRSGGFESVLEYFEDHGNICEYMAVSRWHTL